MGAAGQRIVANPHGQELRAEGAVRRGAGHKCLELSAQQPHGSRARYYPSPSASSSISQAAS